jgi:large subunit ribosomal protein L28
MKVCALCGKGIRSGHKISHAHNLSKRKWYPNVKRVKVIINGTVKKTYVCTKCLKSGKVKKPPKTVRISDNKSPATSS